MWKAVGIDARLPDPPCEPWIGWGPGRTPKAESDPAARKAPVGKMPARWETEAPGTIPYQPPEADAIGKTIKWRPMTLHVLNLRADNLSFPRA